MNAIISVEKLSKSYIQSGINIEILHEISFQFMQGSSYAIMGNSGSGKSTLIHLLSGIEQPSSGNITLTLSVDHSINYTQLGMERKASLFEKNVAIVLQQSFLFSELTVFENVVLKARLIRYLTDEDVHRAEQLLTEVGLADKIHAYPGELSGGQQQRVAILRAIFVVPQFLLLDEPTGNLDEASGDQVIELLFKYHKKYNMGLIMSTHNQQIAEKMESVCFIKNKKIYNVRS